VDLSAWQSRGADRSAVLWQSPFYDERHGFTPALELSYRF
jgi:hypothetical protein